MMGPFAQATHKSENTHSSSAGQQPQLAVGTCHPNTGGFFLNFRPILFFFSHCLSPVLNVDKGR